MKKTIILLFILGICLSCNDQLDILPEEAIVQDNISSKKEFYSILRNLRKNTERLFPFSIKERTAIIPCAGLLSSTYSFYEVNSISLSNILLDRVEKIEETEPEWKNLYKGEVLFYKAYIHFCNVLDMGDHILVKDKPVVGDIAKTPWIEILDYAISLAEEAALLLPPLSQMTYDDVSSIQNLYFNRLKAEKFIPSQGATYALLAHMYAWKAGCRYFVPEGLNSYDSKLYWEKAEKACNKIIESEEYELEASPKGIIENTSKGMGKENIFVLPLNWINNNIYGRGKIYADLSWQNQRERFGNDNMPKWAPYCRNNRFTLNWIEQTYKPGDLRKEAYFGDTYELAKQYPEYFNGYAGYSKHNITQKNEYVGMIWRLAEIILLRAEARSRLEDIKGAVEDINTVRKRAKAPLYDNSEYGGDLRLAVFREREKELLHEGYRWTDIIRNGPDYIKNELGGDFKELTVQDYIDGCFFSIFSEWFFQNNTLMRQNTFWFKRLGRTIPH